VHVFVGRFRDLDEACAYSQEQRDETPVLLMTEDERRASEARYPHWPMRIDLSAEFLDHDYIETIADMNGLNRYDYLKTMLSNPEDIERIRQLADPEANILVLIFKGALGGFDVAMRSTPRLTYCGEFPSTI
jgi:hypothetical protein